MQKAGSRKSVIEKTRRNPPTSPFRKCADPPFKKACLPVARALRVQGKRNKEKPRSFLR
jgi:hypothetical protein